MSDIGDIFDAFITGTVPNLRRLPASVILGQSPLQNNTLQVPASRELAECMNNAFMMSFLLGMDHAAGDIDLADDLNLEYLPEPISFDEATSFLKDRIPLSKKSYYALEPKLRFRAFSAARLAQYDAIEAIRQQIIKSQDQGKTLAQFWSESSQNEILKKAGFHKSDPWYWETVFRTNIQTDYNAGRLMQFRENPPAYYEFVGILDSRQSTICRQRSGVKRPAKDSWWTSNWPPLHFACRSTVRGIDAAEAKVLPVTITPVSKMEGFVDPQKGFGGDPLETGSFYKLTPEMKKRARQYGIEGEIAEAAKRMGVK
ncbi:MAG: minor capsid protein [Nitrospirae bacterium]|nr:minor capsid protein [Nitrospirota bacterium]